MRKKIGEWAWKHRFRISRLMLTWTACWFVYILYGCLNHPSIITAIDGIIAVFAMWYGFRVLDRMKKLVILQIKAMEERLAAYEQLKKSLTDLQSAVTKFHSSFQQPSKN